MTHLEKLQEALAEYKQDARLAKLLQDLKLTPAWKELIEDAYQKGLANRLVSGLISANPQQKEIITAELTGISGLTKFLKTVTDRGEVAASNIQDCENAINELLGEERNV